MGLSFVYMFRRFFRNIPTNDIKNLWKRVKYLNSSTLFNFFNRVGPVIYGIVFISFAMANIAGFLLVKFNFNVLDWSSFFWIGFALTAFGMIMNNCFFDEKYRFKKVVKQPKAPKKIEMSKTEKKTMAESKPNDVFNTNLATESQRPMMTTEKDLKGNAIVKESGDDFGIVDEKGKSFDLKKSHLDRL